jgi:tRNA 2-selenouridine synthase
MAIRVVEIEEFIKLSLKYPVLDVRSPGEYQHAHIPNAYSLALFDDHERAVVGTIYKKNSREDAIKKGLEFFGKKMLKIVEEVEEINKKLKDKNNKTVLIHCWRGGMRSAAVAWLLDVYGLNVYTIVGGYKSFRKKVIEINGNDRPYTILGGYTGSAKTEVLQSLRKLKATVIDLEAMAQHRGSAFGAIGQPAQPSQEMFENKLALALHEADKKNNPIWLEDESQRIGILNIPAEMWQVIRTKPVVFIDIPFEKRLDHIQNGYGKLNKGDLAGAIVRIKKRLGGLETKTALNYLTEDNTKECFRILLLYYDKLYHKALLNRPEPKPVTVMVRPEKYEHKNIAELVLNSAKELYGKN